MKKVIFLTLVLSFVFVSVKTVLAIPPHINNRCENGEFIQVPERSEVYDITLPERNIQVCSVFFYHNEDIWRFTQDYQTPQNEFYAAGLGMNKLYLEDDNGNYHVYLWYKGVKPDKVEVYYRYDLEGESLIGDPPRLPEGNHKYFPIIIR